MYFALLSSRHSPPSRSCCSRWHSKQNNSMACSVPFAQGDVEVTQSLLSALKVARSTSGLNSEFIHFLDSRWYLEPERCPGYIPRSRSYRQVPNEYKVLHLRTAWQLWQPIGFGAQLQILCHSFVCLFYIWPEGSGCFKSGFSFLVCDKFCQEYYCSLNNPRRIYSTHCFMISLRWEWWQLKFWAT